jgi:uncharacterized protein
MIKRDKEIISKEEIVCKTRLQMGRGLMFRSDRKNLIMYLTKERKVSLHMFFVFYPIDVLLLDQNKKVIEIKENFKPFSFWNSKNKGSYIIELGKEKSKRIIKVGDQLKF